MDPIPLENLCLGAEVIIVLLLIAFAWRPNQKAVVDDRNAVKELMDWTPAKLAFLQSSLFRGLYVQHWKASASGPEKPFLCTQGIEGEVHSEVPIPWQDRLTKLTNRQGFDAVLREWTSINSDHRKRSCVSMITLNEYSQILATHGAIATERAIRAFASHLSLSIGTEALISRYQAERFMVLSFAASDTKAFETMLQIREKAAAEGFFEHQGTTMPIACIVSVMPIDGEESNDSLIELLEEGYLHADDNKCVVICRSKQTWSDQPPVPSEADQANAQECESPLDSSAKEFLEGQLESTAIASVAKDEASSISESASEPSVAVTTAVQKAGEENPNPELEAEAPNSNDITAIANPDDIEALFAQIRSQKQKDKPSSISTPASAPASAPVSMPPNVTNVTEAATADDIAALFAANKPSSIQQQASPRSVATTAQAASNAIELDDAAQTASADDIAALFAANKPSPSNSLNSGAAVKSEMDQSELATEDDIAALFASVKQGLKPATNPPKGVSLTPTPQGKPAAQPEPAPQPEKAPQVEPALPTAPATPSAAELSETASADDIASLFASLKK